MKYLTIYKDAYGKPRAYGASPSIIDSQAIAKLELEAYRQESSYTPDQEPFTGETKLMEGTESK